MLFKECDIVFNKSQSLLGKLIRFFSRDKGESKTLTNHVGMIVVSGEGGDAWIAESLQKTVKRPLKNGYGDLETITVYRPLNLTNEEQRLIVDKMNTYVGKTYGYIKILLHLGDWYLKNIKGGNSNPYFFRRFSTNENYPICLGGNVLIDCPRDLSLYPKGIPIADLVGKTPYVYAWENNSLVIRQASKVWKSGENVPVYKVVVKSHHISKYWLPPQELIGTYDHLVLLTNGEWRKLGELQPGDSICSVYRSGSPLNKKYPLRPKLCWSNINSERSTLSFEQVFICEEIYGQRPKNNISHHKDNNWLNQNVDNLEWINTAIHTKMHHLNKNVSEFTREIQSKSQKERFKNSKHPMLGKQHSEESKNNMKVGWIKRKEKQNINHKVVSVDFAGYQDVYDMEVPNANSFIANGMVVHNCSYSLAQSFSVANKNFGVPPNTASPDDILDFCMNNPDKYEKIYVGKKFN